MVGELLCPDCGGVVGATQTTEAGSPCRCFIPQASSSDSNSASETITDHSHPAEMPTDVPIAKICRICGKDVAGQKRAKDHLGYYCMDCAKAEELKEHQGRVRCKVCGRLVKEENLILYEGTKMCSTCHRERIDLQKQQIKRLGFKAARTRAELSQIYGMAIALVVLLIIMGYGAMKMFHPH